MLIWCSTDMLTKCTIFIFFVWFRPYKKPNDVLKYTNVLPNHPTQILKTLPTAISEKLSRNSSSELIFNESKHQYEDVLLWSFE